MSAYLRPDEQASKSQIERSHSWNKAAKKAGSTALNIGATIAGAGIAQKILPFLNEFISPELALKGISKVSPKLGDILNRGMSRGLNLKDGLAYLKEQFEGKGQYAGGEPEEEEEEIEQPQKAMKPEPTNHKVPYEGSIKQLLAIGNQPQQPQQAQQAQQPIGPGQQALMQVLQQINAKLGK